MITMQVCVHRCSGVADVWVDVLVCLLLYTYMLILPQGQCWVSVLIGFRGEEGVQTADRGEIFR